MYRREGLFPSCSVTQQCFFIMALTLVPNSSSWFQSVAPPELLELAMYGPETLSVLAGQPVLGDVNLNSPARPAPRLFPTLPLVLQFLSCTTCFSTFILIHSHTFRIKIKIVVVINVCPCMCFMCVCICVYVCICAYESGCTWLSTHVEFIQALLPTLFVFHVFKEEAVS